MLAAEGISCRRRAPACAGRRLSRNVPRPDRRRAPPTANPKAPRCGCAHRRRVHRDRPAARQLHGVVDDLVLRRGDAYPPTTWRWWSTMRRRASTRWCGATICCRHRRGRRTWLAARLSRARLCARPPGTERRGKAPCQARRCGDPRRDRRPDRAGPHRRVAGIHATTVDGMLAEFDPVRLPEILGIRARLDPM
jgi:hypothetical protein